MTKRVLLVAEDDPVDHMLLDRAVRKCADCFMLVRVANGDEAIEYLAGAGAFGNRSQFPAADLLLLDLKMPGRDGFSVLQWRRDQGQHRHLPIIVFSSSSLPADVERAYALGANSYVVKPDQPENLERMVKALRDWWTQFNITVARSPLQR